MNNSKFVIHFWKAKNKQLYLRKYGKLLALNILYFCLEVIFTTKLLNGEKSYPQMSMCQGEKMRQRPLRRRMEKSLICKLV